MSDWYQSYFPNVMIDPKNRKRSYYSTTQGGWRISTTPGSKATGLHPDYLLCHPAGTLIETSVGAVPIEEIFGSAKTYYAKTSSGAFRRITRATKRPASHTLYIRHCQGIVPLTPEHPIWIEGAGFTEAVNAQYGDRLQMLNGESSSVMNVYHDHSEQPVYGLSVDIDHDYYADGVLVHNCDDPHNVKGAESEKMRKQVLDWWDNTISTRGVVRKRRTVITMQRLHSRDLVGHIMENKEKPDKRLGWVWLCLPFEYDPDEALPDQGFGKDPRTKPGQILWPEVFSDESAVASMKADLGPYGVAGQLQQRPTLKDGGMFHVSRINTVTAAELPKQFDSVVRAWDRAGTKDGGCYTAGVLIGWSKRQDYDRFFILDVIRKQYGTDEVLNLMKLTANIDSARYGHSLSTVFEQEPSNAGKQAAAEVLRVMRGHTVTPVPPRGDKPTRAVPFSNAVNQNEVFALTCEDPLPGKPYWLADFLSELEAFPLGSYVDQVDAASLAYSHLTSNDWMIPIPKSGDEEDVLSFDECPHCGRPSEPGFEFCCEGCEMAFKAGNPTKDEGLFGHCAECNLRASNAYAKGWEASKPLGAG
ncbi:phage terminase large subunit [Rosistilla oblonga]|uniref:phage terminase large subunit n=1 Tax=Rosistilla oblonga TaxID=2527990 RepID=UPI003A97312B